MDKFVFALISETLTRLAQKMTFHCHTLKSSWITTLATRCYHSWTLSPGITRLSSLKKTKRRHHSLHPGEPTAMLSCHSDLKMLEPVSHNLRNEFI